jgi:hypothetical protein
MPLSSGRRSGVGLMEDCIVPDAVLPIFLSEGISHASSADVLTLIRLAMAQVSNEQNR